MFERYSGSAKRVVFFARYEAATSKCDAIDTKHLLLGVLRGGNVRIPALAEISAELRKEMGMSSGESYQSTSKRQIPLTDASKRTLAYAADEAARLSHYYIEPEHLVAGMLRESDEGPGGAFKKAKIDIHIARGALQDMQPASASSEAKEGRLHRYYWFARRMPLWLVLLLVLLFAAVWFIDKIGP